MSAPMVDDFAEDVRRAEEATTRFLDDPQAQRRSIGLPDIGGIDAVAAAHKRFGEAVIRLEGLGYQLERAFDRLEEATAQMLEAKVRAEPILSAPVQAALTAWQADKVSEAPLGVPIP